MPVIGPSQLQPNRGAAAVNCPKTAVTETKKFAERFVPDRVRRSPVGCAKIKERPGRQPGGNLRRPEPPPPVTEYASPTPETLFWVCGGPVRVLWPWPGDSKV